MANGRIHEKDFSFREQVIPVCLSKLRENDTELAPIICYALEFADDYCVVEPLLEILTMPSVCDKVKLGCLQYCLIMVLMRESFLEMIMKDFDKMASNHLQICSEI